MPEPRRIARSIEYVGTLDTTITGSRNAVAPLILWYAIQRWGKEGFAQQVAGCLENAEYAVRRFRENGVEAWRNPHAITVVLPRPAEAVVSRWQIAVQEEIGHMIVMPHVSKSLIDEFVAEYLAAREKQ